MKNTSKKPRKKYRKGRAVKDPVTLAILGSAAMPVDDQLQRLTILRPAFEAFVQGRASQQEAREVVATHNVVLCLSRQPGVLKGDVHDFLQASHDTITDIAKRFFQHGTKAVRPEEAEVMWALFHLYEQVLENVPIRNIERAEWTVKQRSRNKQDVRNLDDYANTEYEQHAA